MFVQCFKFYIDFAFEEAIENVVYRRFGEGEDRVYNFCGGHRKVDYVQMCL